MGTLLRQFTNVGMHSRFRTFPGFPAPSEVEHQTLAPRGVCRVTLKTGDLVTLSGSGASVWLAVLGADGRSALAALGLEDGSAIAPGLVDGAEVFGWAQAQGLSPEDLPVSEMSIADPVILRASGPCIAWVLYPAGARNVVSGTAGPEVQIAVSRAATDRPLPDPLGTVLDEFTVTRGTARAYALGRGQYVQIIDIEGQQCSDFMAFRAGGLDRADEVMIDATATRSMVRRAYPRPGLLDKFFDRDMRPLLQIVQDTCGRHDTFGLACTARGYEDRGFPGHLNCSDNISDAMAPFGVARRAAWPAVNFFWNTWVDPVSNEILTDESHSRPGDYVVLRALTDLVCVSTACPDDIDPINGWNPTDIHVRIYAADAPAHPTIGYRVKEDSAMSIGRESAFRSRTATLTDDVAPARDLWLPATYPSHGMLGEYWACREAVTLQDMSSLRKYDVAGPDAERLLQQLLTRDLARLAQWRGTYALMCDETGAVVDDGTLFRLGPQLFRWCCGSEESARRITALADADGLQVRVTDMSSALANAALQGPKSRDLLAGLVFTQAHVPSLDQLKWFGVTIARLHDREGTPFMLSRTGYTGELGYEVFCAGADAPVIWDALMDAGQELGIKPMGTAALETIRIEAGLAAAGAEFQPGHDAWESGLGFAVDLRKPDFVGRDALERNARDPRRVLKGLSFKADEVPRAGAPVLAGEREVGTVTSATRSPMLGHGIAMARLAVEHSDTGTTLDVGMLDGRMKRLPATVTEIPFVDPRRERARA